LIEETKKRSQSKGVTKFGIPPPNPLIPKSKYSTRTYNTALSIFPYKLVSVNSNLKGRERKDLIGE